MIHVHGPLLFFHVFVVIFQTTNSKTVEAEALLKLKESFQNATVLDSWKPGTEPCAQGKHWVGVVCAHGVVSGLLLGHSGLSGKIDVDALVLLSRLRSVAFLSNSFSGPIPDFNRLGALRGLYISDNQFLGEIPSDYFSKMAGLKKVWLSRNEFSGPVPSSLARLSQLLELHLENNQFSGTIPPLEQKNLVSLNLSNNNLEGEIPAGLLKFSPNAFQGNAGLCGGNSGRACDHSATPSPDSPKDHNSKNGLKIAIWVIVAVILVLLLIIVAVIAILLMRRTQETLFDAPVKENLDTPVRTYSTNVKKDINSNRKGFGSAYRAVSSRRGKPAGDLVLINNDNGSQFGMSDLMKAAAEVLGNGSLGLSYKAMMDGGATVVVKRIKEMNKTGRDKFDAEMRRLANLKHKNLLRILAYHYRKEEKLLVYEYQQKGSLMFLLHGDRGISHADLTWPVRFKIIQGIARGLGYLHTELSTHELPHGDLKSSNVLLTRDYEPLLSDYGFCPLISSSQAAEALSAYKSPEAALNLHVSPKSDVFCLGVMILEILSGKFPCQFLLNAQGGTDLVQWIRSAIQEGREADLLDPDIANAKNFQSGMVQLLHIGAACTETNPDRRLDLREAIRRIDDIDTCQRG
ncbi:Pollen receptor-like kinase [Sesamum alatum]|uniref:Pollen receptor-like kinase n=1 Tax=Sesamum alatum TaxID=300844 RepID=A0AAE2CMB0_9LAMI|nr:Pollen receptor-like kinase [Sesamum alatum]